LARCDTGPRSPANQAIARFVKRTLAGTATPFEVNVDVVRSDIANAFALPGGHVYYFSALIEESPDGDAFAGVLAHEIGHVVNRHGLENAIATAGSGLVVGMLLGDVTGFSVGAILGQALINSRFSREAEHAADLFAIETARRVGFDVHALGAVLRQIAADTGESRVLSLLSSHPLTEERAVLLDASPVTGAHAFTPAEWRAIATMC
ncbi:MAG: M48 family metallopeptidase, partial [Cucumibacter sp.]